WVATCVGGGATCVGAGVVSCVSIGAGSLACVGAGACAACCVCAVAATAVSGGGGGMCVASCVGSLVVAVVAVDVDDFEALMSTRTPKIPPMTTTTPTTARIRPVFDFFTATKSADALASFIFTGAGGGRGGVYARRGGCDAGTCCGRACATIAGWGGGVGSGSTSIAISTFGSFGAGTRGGGETTVFGSGFSSSCCSVPRMLGVTPAPAPSASMSEADRPLPCANGASSSSQIGRKLAEIRSASS